MKVLGYSTQVNIYDACFLVILELDSPSCHYLKSGQNILLNLLLCSTEGKIKSDIGLEKHEDIFIFGVIYSFNL